MEITLNGKKEALPGALTLAEALKHFSIPVERIVAEWNGRIITRREFSTLPLTDGGRLEIVRIVGGG
jgi:thiamine biosynthesis protein ThiS